MTWHTDTTLHADAQGQASVRGFRGRYSVSVEAGGKKQAKRVSLGANGASTNVMLD